MVNVSGDGVTNGDDRDRHRVQQFQYENEKKCCSDESAGDDDDDVASLHRLGLCRIDNGPDKAMMGADGAPDQEKRMRREIANSNERRRMQSINAGFQTLRALLPRKDGEKMSKASVLQKTAEFIRMLLADKEQLLCEIEKLKRLTADLDGQEHEHTRLLLNHCDERTGAGHMSPTSKAPPAGLAPKIMAPPKKRRRNVQMAAYSSSDEGVELTSCDDTDPSTAAGRQDNCQHELQSPPANNNSDYHQLTPCWTQNKSPQPQRQHQQPNILVALERERRLRLLLEEELRRRDCRSGVSLEPLTVVCAVLAANDSENIGQQQSAGGQLSSAELAAVQTPLVPPTETRQSLETIVEAIRHLEGDQLFVDLDQASAVRLQRQLY